MKDLKLKNPIFQQTASYGELLQSFSFLKVSLSIFRSLWTWHLHMGAAKDPELLECPPSLTTFSHILFHSSSFQIPISPWYNPNFVAPRDSCHFCLRAPTCYIFSFKLLNNFSWWGFFWDALLDFLVQETGTSADALWDLLGQKTELVSNLWNPPRRHSLPGLNLRNNDWSSSAFWASGA